MRESLVGAMLGQFKIEDVSSELEQVTPIFRRDELLFTEGPLDLYEGTLMVLGDGGPGSVVRGIGNVVINGSLLGNSRMPIRIEVDGDVVVKGAVSHAVLDANTVYVGTDASDVQVNARLGFEVGGDLTDARVRVGEYDLARKKIDYLKKGLADAQWERDATERKLRMEEKRVDKMFKNTRVILASNVGRILQAKRNRLVINLQPIYESLSNRQEQDMDKALREFFAKAIVGLLTRANQHFLVGKNRHRQEIFKGIVRDVHDLFFLTRKFDKQTQQCTILNQWVDDAIQVLNGRVAGIYVGGRCKPELNVSVTIPEVTVSDNGQVMISGDMARLQGKVSQTGGIDVKCVSTLGIETCQTGDIDILENCKISVLDGNMIWCPLRLRDVVGA
ncbi:MAG: hypothetical protein ACO36I_05555 [Candidatus Latescibacterota bacterium]|jgi:hypothetical protein